MLKLILFYCSIAFSLPTFAATIDQAFLSVFSENRNPSAHQVVQAYRALMRGQLNESLSLIRAVQVQKFWADYGYYLEAEVQLARARKDLKLEILNQYQNALGILQAKYPRSPLLEEIPRLQREGQVLWGRFEIQRKNEREALEHWEQAFELSQGKKINGIPFNVIRDYSQICKKRKTEACLWWISRLANHYPDQSLERDLILKAFPNALSEDKINGVSKKSQTYPSRDRDDVDFQGALELYLKADWSGAREAFQEFILAYPKSRHRIRSLFLIARCYDRLGAKKESKAIYELVISEGPLTYYAIASSMISGFRVEDYLRAEFPEVERRDRRLTPAQLRSLERAEIFFTALEPDLVALELGGFDWSGQYGDGFLLYLTALKNFAGLDLGAFRFLGELFQRGSSGVVSSYALRWIFPERYSDPIQKYSALTNLDPILTLSLIKQESAFRSHALSVSGAMGLMQLMPFTAIEVEAKLPISRVLEIEKNIELGTKYLSQVLKRFNGNVVYALGSYNAGPHRMSKWTASKQSHWDMIDFIEAIPFKETREYVSGILRNYYWYSIRLRGQRIENFQSMWLNP